jgi:hypothetical protein
LRQYAASAHGPRGEEAAVLRPSLLPVDLDVDRPNAARIYDYFLGGSHNLAADRAMARKIVAAEPSTPLMAQANRGFMRRAVRYCLDAGIRQFLDLGSGIPTAGNVHELAHRVDPQARVVYVDREPVAVAHSRVILAGNDRVAVLHADLREPDRILADPAMTGLLDIEAPIGVLMVSVLPFILDEDEPDKIVARFVDAVVPGSYLAISHGTVRRNYHDWTPTPLVVRSPEQIAGWFAGCDLVEPGLVDVQQWRSDWLSETDEPPTRNGILAAVGRKR